MKKSKEELFVQFQSELDKERKWTNQLMVICVCVVCVLFAIGMSALVVDMPWSFMGKIIFIIVTEVVIILMFFILSMIIWINDKRSTPDALKKIATDEIKSLGNDLELLETYKSQQESDLVKKNVIIPNMQNVEDELIQHIRNLAKIDEDKIIDYENDIKIKKNMIYELETKIEFYNQFPKRTVREYFRSIRKKRKT